MSKAKTANGLTVLEVLFAMVIILVGMVGIAAMIPFAGRQAEDSYQISQGLAAGENAIAVFNSHSVAQPSQSKPWQMVDDVYDRTNGSVPDCENPTTATPALYREKALMSVGSMRALYESLNEVSQLAPGSQTPADYFPGYIPVGGGSPTAFQIAQNHALRQNNIIGTGFCIDPLFWGNQEKTAARISRFGSGVFRRTRFPFFDEYTVPTDLSISPASFTSDTPGTPRLMRISLRDSIWPAITGWNGRNSWLNTPSSLNIATSGGGDILQTSIESNKQLAPIRGIRSVGTSLIDTPNAGAYVSWMATLTPSDSTPIIDPKTVVVGTTGAAITKFPEIYDLAVVVFSRRDPRLDLTSTVPPTTERLVSVSFPTTENLTSGSFDIDISADASVNGKVRIGDWLMLSRNIFTKVSSSPDIWAPIRQRHRWYRVISVPGTDSFPQRIRVSGAPWDFTEAEVTFGIPPFALPVVATLVKDVVQVYQRTIELKID